MKVTLHKPGHLVAFSVLLALSMLSIANESLAQQKLNRTLYVSPMAGLPENNGLSEKSPFKSIEQAQEFIRTLDKSRYGSATVMLASGRYELKRPLDFTERDGGNSNFRVSYKSAESTPAVISGGGQVKNWALFDRAKNIYRAKCSFAAFRQLYVNGHWATRARYPNDAVSDQIKWDTAGRRILIPEQVFQAAGLKPDSTTELVTLGAFSANHLKIKSAVLQNGQYVINLLAGEECVFRVAAYAFQGKNFYIENGFSLIDREGEWFYDRNAGYVYYKPEAGEDMSHAFVEAPVLEKLMRVQGASLSKRLGQLEFEGITFACSNWSRPANLGIIEYQACQYFMPASGRVEYTGRPAAAIVVRNADRVSFRGCHFRNMASTALDYLSGTAKDTVSTCLFNDIGGNGLSVGLLPKETEPDTIHFVPDSAAAVPHDILVKDNLITRIGRGSVGAVGIFYAYASEMTITHNELHDLPYTGISGGWGWNAFPSVTRHNVISNNYVHDFMKVFYDGGGVYTLSRQIGSIVSDNYIENHSLGERGYGWNGLYFDEGSRNFTIQNNVVDVQEKPKIHWLTLQDFAQGARECTVVANFTTSNVMQDNHQKVSDTRYFPKGDWPVEAKSIIQRAGLEPEFRFLIEKEHETRQTFKPIP